MSQDPRGISPLFDCALHFRFLQKATEAMFEMGQASVAAALACQKRALEDLSTPTPEPEPQPNPMMWFSEWFAPAPPKVAPQQPDLMQSWMAMASACSQAYWPNPQARSVPALPMNPMFAGAAIPSFWGMSPWTMYQGPMVAMMLSYGVPYAVAAPTARASTSAMDAADAACAQWRLVFGSPEGQRSLARNVTAPDYWPKYLH